jgi:serine/threonine protein kinase
MREIGRGGMGVVYLAVEQTLERQVALKVAYPSLLGDGRKAARIIEEAQAAARLDHPGVVKVYAAGRHRGMPFVVMEYVAGRSLRDLLTRKYVISESKALEIVRQVLGALGAAHAAGIVHRDIKPANIRLSFSGRVKVMDFGIAGPVGARARDEGKDCFVGTPEYASPEQARLRPLDGRSDLYSLGLVLFEMLTGSLPFQGGSAAELLRARCGPEAPRAEDRNPALAKPLCALLAKMLSPQTAARYASAEKVLEDIERIAGSHRPTLGLAAGEPEFSDEGQHETATAVVVSWSDPDPPKPSTRPSRVLLGGLVAGVVLGLLGGFLVFFRGDDVSSPVFHRPVSLGSDPETPDRKGLSVHLRFCHGNEQARSLDAGAEVRNLLSSGLSRTFPVPVKLEPSGENPALVVEGRVLADGEKVWIRASIRDAEGRPLHVCQVLGRRAEFDRLCADLTGELLTALLDVLYDLLDGEGGFSASVEAL